MYYSPFLHNEHVCMFLSLLQMNFFLHQLIFEIHLPLFKVFNLFLITTIEIAFQYCFHRFTISSRKKTSRSAADFNLY